MPKKCRSTTRLVEHWPWSSRDLYIRSQTCCANMSMKAVKWLDDKNQLEMVDVDVPTKPSHGHVILKVAYCGVCGTDVLITKKGYEVADGVTLGHEFTGVVTEVGEGVTTLKVGDEVAANPMSGCGTCRNCAHTKPHVCTNGGGSKSYLGFWYDGAWANFCVVAAANCVVLPRGLTLKQAVLSEPMACITTGFKRNGQIPVDARILVMGAGIAGIIWTSLFHYHGYRDITVTNRSSKRRDIIRSLDIGVKTLHPDEIAKSCADQAAIEQVGYDLIIDCSGNIEAVEKEFMWLRSGGTINLYSCYRPGDTVKLEPQKVMSRDLTIVGSVVIQNTFLDAVRYLVNMSSRYFDFDKIGVKIFKLDQYKEALAALEKREITKAVFEFPA